MTATAPSSGTSSRTVERLVLMVLEGIAIMIVYKLLGDLTRRFEPLPDGVSPIWFPAGFALGVVLVRGWWTALPIGLGVFISSTYADLTQPASVRADLPSIYISGVVFAIAVAGHCLLGRLLIERFVPDRKLESVPSAMLFLLFAGPLSCLFSGLLGPVAYVIDDFFGWNSYPQAAFTFWVGDAAACMIIPQVFVAYAGGAAWRNRRLAILITSIGVVSIVGTVTSLFGRAESHSGHPFVSATLPASILTLGFAFAVGVLALAFTGQREQLRRLVRRRTQELETSERRYKSVVDNAREAIFQLDEAGRISFVNASWNETLTDGGHDAATGLLLSQSLRVTDSHRLQELIDQARATPGTTSFGEFEAADNSGHLYEIRIAATTDASNHEQFVGMVLDVTDQRAVLRNRERFVSLVAHELRNPLTVISGAISTIGTHESDQLPPLATRLLPAVRASAEKLDRIIADLLVSSQVDAGTLTLLEEPGDMHAVIAAACQAASMSAAERDIELVNEADGEPLLAMFDVDRIAQVIDNLLSNAIKYTPVGGTVRVFTSHDDHTTRVLVTDTGIGIAPGDHRRIFERYGRTPEGAIVATGTGLGLSICLAIAEAHGGTITVDSRPGEGSTFTLAIPTGLPSSTTGA